MKLRLLSAVVCILSVGVAADDPGAVVKWIGTHAVPLRSLSLEAANADLMPLKSVLRDVQVVGAGESSHGAREFVRFKGRLFRFLVTELGYTGLALEASYSGTKALDRYVMRGEGSLERALAEQGYVAWQTEEMSELLEWLRAHNRTVKASKKVRVFGLDTHCNLEGRRLLLAWVKKNAPERLEATAAAFRVLDGEETRWPRRIDKARLASALPAVRAVAELIRQAPVSADALEDLQLHAIAMEQWVRINSPEATADRSVSMGENLLYVLDRQPGFKVFVSAFNSHVGRRFPSGRPNLGHQVGQALGSRYYALGLEFHGGSFQTRVVRADMTAGELREVTLPEAPEKSLPWFFKRVGLDAFVVDFRRAGDDAVMTEWLKGSHTIHSGGWAYEPNPEKNWSRTELGSKFDGYAFVEQVSGTHPTRTALAGTKCAF